MRIIAGCAKKRLLKAPSGWKGRPTADRVKESLFNIIGNLVDHSVFLDIFAGTGSIGIEALSRGAQKAVFVESNNRAWKAIIKNLEDAKLIDNAEIIVKDANIALTQLKAEKFDIIFLDPPYDQGFEVPILTKIIELELLSEKGIIVVESSKRQELPVSIGEYVQYKQRKYGDTLLTFFKK